MGAVDDAAGFRAAMRLLASGVVMVTTRIDGRPWGLTISACCSLSADPPQILISLGTQTATCRQVLDTGRFGLSLLGTRHRELAEVGAAPGAPKFVDDHCEEGGEAGGPPRVRDAIYHLDCEVVQTSEIADHTLFVGRVVRSYSGPEEAHGPDPLIYFDRAYRQVGSGLA